jgi:hypothetical protein
MKVEDNKNLKNKRGLVIFDKSLTFNEPDLDLLKAVFSNFYPIAIEPDHTFSMYGKLKMYGYSEHFREVEEDVIIPSYEFIFTRDGNGNIYFKEAKEIKL